jgi:hypothetical protein
MSSTTDRLEREATDARLRLDADLQELRRRATPGHLVDEAIDYVRGSGGADFLRNLGDQVRDNPLPVVVIGMSMAWLMYGKGTARRADTASALERVDTQGMKQRANSAFDSTREAGSELAGTASELASGASNATRGFANSAMENGARLADRARATYNGTVESADQMAGRVREASAGLAKMIQDQPLILAGFGLAAGAAIGTALPLTETENEVLGDAGRELRRQGEELLNQAKPALSSIIDKVEDDHEVAGPGGLSPANTPQSDVAENR